MKKVIKNSGIFIAYTIYFILIRITPIFALEKGYAEFGRNLVISQEKYRSGGILISRPSPLDEKIRNLIIFNNIRVIEDYIQWLQKNIQYKKDKGPDTWSAPEETLHKKYGDCEDLAFLNAAFLRVGGYQPKVWGIVRQPGRNHAICAFKENGYYSWIDNAKLKRTQAQSIVQFAKHILREYDCISICELHSQTKGWDILFKKSEILK